MPLKNFQCGRHLIAEGWDVQACDELGMTACWGYKRVLMGAVVVFVWFVQLPRPTRDEQFT